MKIFTRLVCLMFAASVMLPSFAATLPTAPVTNEPTPATVKSAMDAFKGLSKKEKKERIKLAKKALKDYKMAKKQGKEPLASKAVQVIVAILLPPLGMYLHEGEINSRFWISLLLTLLFYLPGLIYTLVIILGDE